MTPQLTAVVFGFVLISFAGCRQPETTGLEEILINQSRRYPVMEVQDLYKLVHQAALGPAHAVTDTAAARAWLDREISTLKPGPDNEPLWELLRPDSTLVRVNLRPYVASNRDLASLLESFVLTSRTFEGSYERLDYYWGLARGLANRGRLPFAPEAMDSLFARQADKGHPAIHHTAAYTRAFAPAYRVVNPKSLNPAQ